MKALGWCLFDTAVGPCGLAWSGQGICAVQLPEATPALTRKRMARTTHGAAEAPPTGEAQQAVAIVQALLAGQPHDESAVVLDMRGVSDFQRRVYSITRRIPPGQTRTYGEIAAELGDKRLARAVGQALGLNPFAPVIPCHRVLAAGSKPGGFSAHGGAHTKLRMLAAEGALQSGQASLFDGP